MPSRLMFFFLTTDSDAPPNLKASDLLRPSATSSPSPPVEAHQQSDASHSHQLQLHNVLTLIITCQCTIFNTDMSYTGGDTSVFISPAVFILTNIAIIMASIYSISLSITIT